MKRYYISTGCGKNIEKYYLNENIKINGLICSIKDEKSNLWYEYEFYSSRLACPKKAPDKNCINCQICEFFESCLRDHIKP